MGHSEAPVTPGEMQDDPSALPTFYIGAVGSLLTVIAILICAWVYYAVDGTIEEEGFARDASEYREQMEEQLTRLKGMDAAKAEVIRRYGK